MKKYYGKNSRFFFAALMPLAFSIISSWKTGEETLSLVFLTIWVIFFVIYCWISYKLKKEPVISLTEKEIVYSNPICEKRVISLEKLTNVELVRKNFIPVIKLEIKDDRLCQTFHVNQLSKKAINDLVQELKKLLNT